MKRKSKPRYKIRRNKRGRWETYRWNGYARYYEYLGSQASFEDAIGCLDLRPLKQVQLISYTPVEWFE